MWGGAESDPETEEEFFEAEPGYDEVGKFRFIEVALAESTSSSPAEGQLGAGLMYGECGDQGMALAGAGNWKLQASGGSRPKKVSWSTTKLPKRVRFAPKVQVVRNKFDVPSLGRATAMRKTGGRRSP